MIARSSSQTLRKGKPIVFELVIAGGWLMLPIIVCSIIALAIIVERLWTLRIKRVIPRTLVAQVWEWANEHKLDVERMQKLRSGSPLGRVLAAGHLADLVGDYGRASFDGAYASFGALNCEPELAPVFDALAYLFNRYAERLPQ